MSLSPVLLTIFSIASSLTLLVVRACERSIRRKKREKEIDTKLFIDHSKDAYVVERAFPIVLSTGCTWLTVVYIASTA